MASSTSQLAPPPTTSYDPRFAGGPPGYDIVAWSIDLLNALGIPSSPTRISMLTTWANHESGGYHAGDSGGLNNPLNTTQFYFPGGTAVSQGGTQGNISNFATPSQGVAAQAQNLLHSSVSFGYGPIVQALKDESPSNFFAAITNSSFGTKFGSTTSLDTGTQGSPSSSTPTPSDVQTTGFSFSNIVAGVFGIANPLDILGSLGIKGPFKAADAFFGAMLSLLTNWRYLLEVAIGGAIAFLGVSLILHDTGADTRGRQLGAVALA